MGLFDKFRKKVREAASEIDTESISAEEGSIEANQALDFKQELTQKPEQTNDEDYWEEIDETENLELPSSSDDDLDIETVVLEIIAEHAGAEGIDYDSIMKHCAQRGLSDEDSIEDVIYALRDDKCEIMEPRFGWFKPM